MWEYLAVDARHMLKAFDGRAGSDAGASHVFPQSALSAITLVRLESEDRVGPGREAKRPLWSVAIPALLREGSDPLRSRRPVREAWAGSIPIKYVSSPLPTPGILSPEGSAEASEVPVRKAAQGAACVGICGSARHSARSSLSLPTPAQIQRCAEARTEWGQSVCFAWAVARDEVVAGNHASTYSSPLSALPWGQGLCVSHSWSHLQHLLCSTGEAGPVWFSFTPEGWEVKL